MGGVRREKGVLKLVHHGGVVEIHNHPITAAQVMEMYPRHCVTRPDVFKYPWIVVRPESILSLDRVFYVVPYHTIRRLVWLNGFVKGTKNRENYEKLAKADEESADNYVIEASSFRKFARVSHESTGQQTHRERRKRCRSAKLADSYLQTPISIYYGMF